MRKEEYNYSRFDLLVSELCDEIDILTRQLADSKEQEKYWREEHSKLISSSLKNGQETVANWVKLFIEKDIVISDKKDRATK